MFLFTMMVGWGRYIGKESVRLNLWVYHASIYNDWIVGTIYIYIKNRLGFFGRLNNEMACSLSTK